MDQLYTADLILLNGKIITMDEDLPYASAVAVKKGEILFVGTDEEALQFQGVETDVTDLNGKTVMPGFIESHIHPTMYGLNLLKVDCRTENTPTIEDVLNEIKQAALSIEKGEWITGWGWDDSKLAERRNITRWDLDKAAPNHPVFLSRTCTHVAVVNSKALEVSGITAETADPKGGHIEKDPDSGELTGLLQEKAMGLADLPPLTLEKILEAMKKAQKDFAKWGITTIHDMSTQKTDMEAYQLLNQAGELTVRVRPWYWAVSQNEWTGLLDEICTLGIKSGFGDDMIKIQGTKFMLDGGVGAQTAAVAEPYKKSGERGILYFEADEIAPYMEQSLKAGLRVAIHAIGERAIEVAVQSFERTNKQLSISHMRNRIEHCALPTDDHLKRIKKMELVAASSIGFLHDIGDSYINNLGPERMKRVFPHKTFKEYGIVAPGNSDLPVTGGNPWKGIYTAVTRKSVSGQVLDTVQNISVEDAIKAYTVDPAYSSFEEESLGLIKQNAKADIIIVSENPFEVEAERLKDLEIESTYIGGKLVFTKEQSVVLTGK